MTPKELEDWLETDESNSAGWTASGEGEAVGHQSGKKIIQILKSNPKAGAPDDYEEEDLKHMRKVSRAPRLSEPRLTLAPTGHRLLRSSSRSGGPLEGDS